MSPGHGDGLRVVARCGYLLAKLWGSFPWLEGECVSWPPTQIMLSSKVGLSFCKELFLNIGRLAYRDDSSFEKKLPFALL